MASTYLNTIMPRWDFHEVHALDIGASPERTYQAAWEATAGEIPLLHLLFDLRSVPARITGQHGLTFSDSKPLLDQMLASGFLLLRDEPGREVVVGMVGQFWKLNGGTPVTVDADEFWHVDRSGYGKVAINFSIMPYRTGSHLRTETRIALPDKATKVRFAVYWIVIRPGSALIRRTWLRAIKRRAEV
jgi:hypothetical protein